MIIYYKEMIQGSEAWHSIRCGVPTASEMKLLVTPTLKVAANEKERAHMWELLAQRLTKHVEPRYISDDMLRGQEDEIEAVALYAKTYEPVERVSADKIDPDFMIQVQTGLMVSERKWCDLISFCGGLPMATVRVYPDEKIQTAILEAVTAFEERLAIAMRKYGEVVSSSKRLIPTIRRITEEIY